MRPALRRLGHRGVAAHPRVLACAPTDASAEEREAVVEACYRAGAAAVVLMPEPVAAALGDGIDYASPVATLLMDIGEGVTDCAVIRRGALSTSFASRIACADLRAAARDAVRAASGVELSDAEAARVVAEVGVQPPSLDDFGLPLLLRSVRVTPGAAAGDGAASAPDAQTWVPAGLIEQALEPVAVRIVGTVRSLLVATPGLRRELRESGANILLSGGGALIPGFVARVKQATGLPVRVVRHPLDAVVEGAKRVLPHAAAHDLWGQVSGKR
jgi:rod shape-determining protein MreB